MKVVRGAKCARVLAEHAAAAGISRSKLQALTIGNVPVWVPAEQPVAPKEPDPAG